jgi:diaminopropionate ammonia-lyase
MPPAPHQFLRAVSEFAQRVISAAAPMVRSASTPALNGLVRKGCARMIDIFCRHVSQEEGALPADVIKQADIDDALVQICAWDGYRETPLVSLAGLADHLGIGRLDVKYEDDRFGLGSFKSLGGAYAVERVVRDRGSAAGLTVATASDGNHGLSVAWGARRHGATCRIYLHEKVSEGRAALIAAMGATVVRVAGNYDDSTHQAEADCQENGWTLVADTALDEADEAPSRVMAGYSVMAAEMMAQLDRAPTHVFIQGGCGGLAAAMVRMLWNAWPDARPMFVLVEPDRADCLFRSAEAGQPVRIDGDLDTVMGGLSVGEVSLSAWRLLWPTVSGYLRIPDEAAIDAMRSLAEGRHGDAPLIAGDAGAAGVAGIVEAAADPDTRRQLGLGPDSHVLTIITEGAVDRAGWQDITGIELGPLEAGLA